MTQPPSAMDDRPPDPDEEELRQHVHELRAVLDSGRMGTWRHDLRSGVQTWSARQYELLGLDPATPATRETFMAMVHPDDYDIVNFTSDDLRPEGSFRDTEFRIVWPDGSVHWMSSHSLARFDENGAPIERIGVNWDITQRKRAEEALREREERLRVALEAGRMGTWRFDLKTGQQQWSDREFEIYGLEPGSEPPTRELFLSLVHPDDLHLVEFTTEDIRPEGTFLDSEFRIIRPDGQMRWIAAHALALFGSDGRPVEVIGANQDVTDQKRIEEARRISEDRLRHFGEASPDVLWIRNAQTLQWDYLSPGFERLYGLTRVDALRGDNYQSWLSLIVEEDRPRVIESIDRLRRGERVTFEYRVRRPVDGQLRWVLETGFPLHEPDGDLRSIAGIGHDVSEARRAEEHQRLLLAELQHRVRNMLAMIRAIAGRTARSSDTVAGYAAQLDGRIEAFARVQAAVTRDPTAGVSLEALLQDELSSAASALESIEVAGPHVRLTAKIAETLGLAVHELATNAVKYGALSKPGGHIRVGWTLAEGATPVLDLVWKETGLSGVPPTPQRRGLGIEILERTLPYELRARTRMDFEDDGLNFTLSLPLPPAPPRAWNEPRPTASGALRSAPDGSGHDPLTLFKIT